MKSDADLGTRTNAPIRFGSFCSGIGAPEMAWRDLGWQPQFFSEIEPFPCAVLKHHFPDVPNLGDMEKIDEQTIRQFAVDVVVAGTPCQSFSVAGLRAGMADPRGNLALVFLRLVDLIKPDHFVWENVPGFLSVDDGEAARNFLDAIEKLGYIADIDILDAQFFDVPQRRRRIFICAEKIESILRKRTPSSALTITQCLAEILALTLAVLSDRLPADSETWTFDASEPKPSLKRRIELFGLQKDGAALKLQENLAVLLPSSESAPEDLGCQHGRNGRRQQKNTGNTKFQEFGYLETENTVACQSTGTSLNDILDEALKIANECITSTGESETTDYEIFICAQATLSIARLITPSLNCFPTFWSAASSALIALRGFIEYARSANSSLFTDLEWVQPWNDFLREAEPTERTLGSIGVESFGEILPISESLSGNFAPSRETGSRIAASLTRGADSSGKGGYAGRRREDDENLISGALNANGKAAGSATQQDAEAGMLLVANCLDSHMGSGEPDDNTAQANHLIPTEVPDICPAIKSRDYKGPSCDGDGDGDGAILVPMVSHSLRADGFDASEDGTGRGTPIIPIDMRQTSRGERMTNNRESGGAPGTGIGEAGDPSFSLATTHVPAIAFDTTQITCPNNFSNPKPGDPCHPLVSGAHAPAIVTVVDSLRLQGYNYGNYGTTDQADAVEILSGMRREIGEKAFEVWRSGISFALQSPEVLQCEMHGSELRQEADEGGPVLVNGSLSCAEDLPARTMRKVRQAEREGRGSQGWELPEQFTRELAATLSRVPQPKTQEKKILFDLWKASKRLGLLQSALSAIEKDGKSAECTNSAPAEVQDLWGASAQQGSVRETLHADEAGKSAQIITSDKMRKEVPGSMAVRRLTPV